MQCDTPGDQTQQVVLVFARQLVLNRNRCIGVNLNWYDVICMQVKVKGAERGKPVSSVFDAMGPDADDNHSGSTRPTLGSAYYATTSDGERQCCIIRRYDKDEGAYLARVEGSFESAWIKPEDVSACDDSSSERGAARAKWSRIEAQSTQADDYATYGENVFWFIGMHVKVWWPDDAYFYPGVVVSCGGTKVTVRYFDNFVEEIDFDSPCLFWVRETIQVNAPSSEWHSRGSKRAEGMARDCGTCATGWRVGVKQSPSLATGSDPAAGAEEFQYEYGFVTKSWLSPASGASAGDSLEMRLEIKLDDGTTCALSAPVSAETRCTWPGYLHKLRDLTSGTGVYFGSNSPRIKSAFLDDKIVWIFPPLVNLDIMGCQRIESSLKQGARPITATVWDPRENFAATKVSIFFSELLKAANGGLDVTKVEGYQEDDQGNLREVLRDKVDLRQAMVKWSWKDLGVFMEGEGTKSGKSGGGEEVRNQHKLHGRHHALVPFVGHAIHYQQGSEGETQQGLRRMVGMRVLVTEKGWGAGLSPSSSSQDYRIRSGIVLGLAGSALEVVMDCAGARERVSLCDDSVYVDVLGRAGDLEATSACLPFLLPVSCQDKEGHFLTTRGLVLYRGYAMSPRDFVDLLPDSMKLDPVFFDWRGAIQINCNSSGSPPTLGKWLTSYRVDIARSVYWGLVSSANRNCFDDWMPPTGHGRRQGDASNPDPRSGSALEDSVERAHANERRLQELHHMMRTRLRSSDAVMDVLYSEWVHQNKPTLFRLSKGRFVESEIASIDQKLEEVVSASKRLEAADTKRDPSIYFVYLSYNRSYEALSCIREYILRTSAVPMDGKTALDLLVGVLKFARAKFELPHSTEFRNKESVLCFERKGSVFHTFWVWASNNMPLPNSTLRLPSETGAAKANPKAAGKQVGKRGAKAAAAEPGKERKKRKYTPRGTGPPKPKRICKKKTLQDWLEKNEKTLVRKDYETICQILRDSLVEKQVDRDRVLKYVDSQCQFFDCKPFSGKDYQTETTAMRSLYMDMIENGPSAKVSRPKNLRARAHQHLTLSLSLWFSSPQSTSMNWLIKFVVATHSTDMTVGKKESWGLFQEACR